MLRRFALAAALAALATSPGLAAAQQTQDAFQRKLFDSPALASPYNEDLSEDEKIAGLSKFWSEVKYNFVFVDTLRKLDWDQLYLDTIPKVRATKSTAEYYKVLMALCAKLQDGHTNVYPVEQLYDAMLASPLLATHLVEGRVLVREVLDPALEARGVTAGSEILAIDGEPVQAYAEREVKPYVSASTPHDLVRRTYGSQLLAGPMGHKPRVTFVSSTGKRVDVALERVGMARYGQAAPRREPFELRMLPGNVAYVALNSFGNGAAADAYLAAFDRIAQSSALVIDLRNNGGGNSSVGYKILATLAAQPFATSKWSTRNYIPTYRAWGRAMPNLEGDSKLQPLDGARRYTKPVVVLTSGRTFSAAEDFMVAFATMKRGTIVGEPTGGSTGQPLFVKLPGGGQARICTKNDTWPDGRQWIGIGIPPDLHVAPTVADVRAGRDTVLDAALAQLRAQLPR